MKRNLVPASLFANCNTVRSLHDQIYAVLEAETNNLEPSRKTSWPMGSSFSREALLTILDKILPQIDVIENMRHAYEILGIVASSNNLLPEDFERIWNAIKTRSLTQSCITLSQMAINKQVPLEILLKIEEKYGPKVLDANGRLPEKNPFEKTGSLSGRPIRNGASVMYDLARSVIANVYSHPTYLRYRISQTGEEGLDQLPDEWIRELLNLNVGLSYDELARKHYSFLTRRSSFYNYGAMYAPRTLMRDTTLHNEDFFAESEAR